MEEALAPPPPPPFSAAASLRRSHLDSASYRTLSRLFSHCLHLRGSPQEAAASGTGDTSGNAGEPPRAQRSPPAPEEPEAVATESLPASKDAGFVRGAGAEEEAVVENPSSDGSCSKDGALAEEEEVLRSVKACLLAEDEKWVGEVLGNEDGQLLLDDMVTGMSILLDGVSNGVMPVQGCGVSEGELQRDEQVNVSAAEATELRGGTEEESPTGNSDHNRVDGGEFEEGEIEGDMQNLDGEALDSEAKDDDADDGKLEGDFISRGSAQDVAYGHDRRSGSSQSVLGSRGSDDVAPDTDGTVRDAQMHVTRVPAVSYEEVVAWNEAPLPGDEAPKPGKKRKRVLTEERKAKKTKNKRIKRAQQARAEGVKRLRLQPVVKAKVVQYCRFYLQGKCQQGDVCKYSHDTTPLTKSKPCTHFARGSCLKGDDCPYDHELSKYPCHNFLENGMCGRGDKCKFSHVMPTAEGPSSTPDAKKSDTPSPYDSANFRKQISSQKTSMVSDGEPVISAPEKPYSILKNLADMSAKAQKAPARIPKGVRFLSFSKEGSDSSSLHQDTLPIEKQKSTRDCNGQKFGGFREEVEKIAEHSGQKPVPTLHAKNSISKATLHPSSEPKNASLSTDFAAASGSRSTQDEVSEASRILQEFLFGTGS